MKSFRYFLTSRKQFVALSWLNYQCSSIKSGVPQGSLLGPLFFFVIINEFPKCTILIKFTFNAEDSISIWSFNNMSFENISNSVNQNYETINHWLNVIKFIVTNHENYFRVFSYRKNYCYIYKVCLNIDIITTSKKIRITLNEKLYFKAHINETCTKLSRSVGIFYKLKSLLLDLIIKNLYYSLVHYRDNKYVYFKNKIYYRSSFHPPIIVSLVHPYFNYDIDSCFEASEYMLKRVRSLQRKSLSAVLILPYNNHTNSSFKNSLILKLDGLYKLMLSFIRQLIKIFFRVEYLLIRESWISN